MTRGEPEGRKLTPHEKAAIQYAAQAINKLAMGFIKSARDDLNAAARELYVQQPN